MANKISQVKLPNNNTTYDISLPGLTVSPSDLNAVSKTIYVGTASKQQTYFKISGFGDWGTGAWYQKNFSMLISSRAGEMVWVSLAADDSNTSAGAFRLINRYSKIDAIFYNTADSSIYVRAKAWANNICAHILSNVNGDQIPTINTVSAIPETAVAITIQEFGVDTYNNGLVTSKIKLGEGSTVGDNLIVNGLTVSVTGSGNAVTNVAFDESTMTITATLGNSFLPLSGGTLTGTLYTSASTPLLIGTNGKVGMRAATADNSNVGQINVSNSWYPDGDQWGAQMSAYNGKTGKRNGIRVSHDGLEYEDENEIRHQVLHDGNYNLHIEPSAIGVYKKDETYAKSEVYNKTEVNNIVDDYLPLTGGTVTGNLTVAGHGLHVSGRYAGGGDDEGIIVGPADNGYAGVTLGDPSGARSVFYLKPEKTAVWRYNNGSGQSEIIHPNTSGTIALTADVDAARAYAETCASTVKSDILGGAEDAYNTLLKLKAALDSGDLNTKEVLEALLNNYVTVGTSQTITGKKTFENETWMLNPSYAPTMNDIASGVGCSLKNSRACDNQLIVAEIFAPYTSKTDEVLNMTSTPHVLPFYAISGISEGKITVKTLLGKINSNGWEGNVKGDVKGTADKAIALTSNAGSSTKPVYFSNGKPVQCDDTLGVNISGKAAVADSATNATYSTYFGLQTTSNLAGTANVLSTRASSWNGASPSTIKSLPWRQAFIDSSISTDSGDFVLGLRPSEYSSGGTELCMFIDGDYYAMGNKVLNTGNYSTTLDGRYAQKSSLATVATSGKYSDLTGTPSLATVATTGKYSDLTGRPSLATVATTGSYNDLKDKPSHDYLSLMGGIVRGDVGVTGKVTQGTTSTDSTISSMNRFQSDLYVQGDGSAPNNPKVAGFYLGKSTTDDNRHMDIVSGGEYSYIDFNEADAEVDYNVRLIANVKSGFTEFQWGGAGTDKTLNVAGTIKQAGQPVATQAWVGSQGYLTSLPSHNHDGVYAPNNHKHDGVYAPASHNHDGTYAPKTHDHPYLPLSGGGTVNGKIILTGTNPHLGLTDSTTGSNAYFQTYDDGSGLKAGFGFGWANSFKIDTTGNLFVGGTQKPQWNGASLLVSSDLPTKTSQLTNDSGYITINHNHDYLPLSGGTLSGSLNFSDSSSWITPYLLSFKNANTSASPTFPYTGFYQWGDEWQVNARDASNTYAHNIMSINLVTKVAKFDACPEVNGTKVALFSDLPTKVGQLENDKGYTTETWVTNQSFATSSALNSAVQEALNSANNHTNTQIGTLINGAPSTLDTIDKLAAALKDNPDVVQVLNDAIGEKQPKGNYVSYTTNSSVSVGGINKPTYVYAPPTNDSNTGTSAASAYFPEGIIMGGTAASAGLMTRGICGINSADATTGACTKDNLYINYDSDNTYREGRQLILQAGSAGTHYGNNLYQYAAARGDAVKNYCDATYVNVSGDTMTGALTVNNTVTATSFKSDSTPAAIKPSDSNELNLGSNANYIYIGYDNRVGSAGAIDTYKFGCHNGAANATNGKIECGQLTAGGAVKGNTVTVGNKVTMQYNTTNECLNFVFA